MATHPFRLAMSPLTRTVFAGRIRQRKGYSEAVGQRHDVTPDFYGVLIQMAESHGGRFTITAKGSPAYEVCVKNIGPAPFPDEAMAGEQEID